MSPDENKPSSDIRESNLEGRPLPAAWQPITPRGVAAFAVARLGRVLLVQFITALLVAASVVWFLSAAWFPTLREAIRQLPDAGLIQGRQLSSPRASTEPLAETRFLAFVVDIDGAGTPSQASDLRVEFHRRNFALCSLLGCLVLEYPAGSTIQFNRPEVESWWGAWQVMIYWLVGLGVVVFLFGTWLFLATIYAPFVRIYAFFKDRELTLAGAWKLSAAALLPAALMTAAGIVFYGLGWIDLVRFLLLWVLHLAVGWAYLLASPLRLPRAADARAPAKNPFGEGKPPPPANPFSTAPEEATSARTPPPAQG